MTLSSYSWAVFVTFACVFFGGTVFASDLAYFTGVNDEYDLKRFLVLGFIWLALLGACFVKKIESFTFSRVTIAVGLIFGILAIVSASFGLHPFWSMVELANFSLLAVAFYLFAICAKSMNRTALYSAIYAGALLFSIMTLAKYMLFLFFSYADSQSFDIHGLLSGYVNVRFFNQLQVMVIPLLLLAVFTESLADFKRVTVAIVAMHWMVLLQTEARGAMLSLTFMAALLWLFVDINARKRLMLTLFQTLFLGICLWLVFIILIPYWLMETTTFQMRTGSSGRLDLWLYVLHAMPESLWLGFGPMSFTWAEGKPLPHAHPHNAIMQLLYEYGVISAMVCITWAGRWIYKRLRYLQQTMDLTLIPTVYALLSGLCYSLFSGVVVMPFAQLLLVFVLALQMPTQTRCTVNIGIRTRLCVFFSVTLVSGLILATYQHEALLSAQFPRLWLNGLLGY
ncbi:O-antigen ligase family protein [Shewanella mangrovisoli]|uniref:O-antigen ligase family protein n=1 Tax=Shewanella mangrovisoli TaxID=2864211 RepID=UPI00370CD85C